MVCYITLVEPGGAVDMTVGDVAAWLRLSRATVYRLLAAGHIQAGAKRGHVDKHSVDDLLSSLTSPATATRRSQR